MRYVFLTYLETENTVGILITIIQVNRSKHSINETYVMEQCIFSFHIKEKLMVMLQNVNDVNKRAHLP